MTFFSEAPVWLFLQRTVAQEEVNYQSYGPSHDQRDHEDEENGGGCRDEENKEEEIPWRCRGRQEVEVGER